ncbi:recombinase family protein [Bacillus cereus]|uniref:recombinase family protein n=1 Tax=Bacillus TaxID=1386 RepID=UPI000BED1AFB|nr:recombinase family protein [Bacillus cereus]MDG1631988.1 recombinase family protein [Bacillus cereus]MDK7407448.1 recombinase family protein [Bacillus cereus]MDK7413091.1 recombinase family protein [Bacillus cereus]PEB35716.1 recombinase [Bacillus cereus]HDX9542112.1 recombinase family protein [Bacillus cereus]
MLFNNENIKHVAVYLRLSRDEENQGIEQVLANHRQTLISLCNENKWSYELFEEVASSSTIINREQMVKLLDRVEQNYYDAVVVMDVDRLSRNEFDASLIKRILLETETYIVTPYRMYDLTRDDDSLLLGITNLIASGEYKQILKRMRRGKEYAQKQGHWTNGIAPLGYTKDTKTKKLVPNERAKDIQFVFSEIAKGTTIPSLIRQLNNMGIKTRQGYDFKYNSIVRIVNNEAYKGTIVSNKTIGQYNPRPKEEWIVVHNVHPAIVDEATWDAANKIVNEYSFKAPRSKNRIYPTSNLIYCANCGKVQGCNNHKRLNKIYIKHCKCGNRSFYYNPVLAMIKEEVLGYKENILKALETLEEGKHEDDTQYRKEKLFSQLNRSTKALNKINILFEEDEIDIITYRERKAKRQEEIKLIEEQITALEREDKSTKIETLQEQIKSIEKLVDKWELLDGEGYSDERVNRLLHGLISGILWSFKKGAESPTLTIIYNGE